MRPTQEEPPLLVKAAGGEVIPFESSVTNGQHSTDRNDELLTAATANPDLWQKVAKGVRWRRCVTHGSVVMPNLTEQEFKDGTVHIRATCPACANSLGFVRRKMIYADDEPADMKRVYRRFLDEARASGCKLGQAYFRFKARYGCDPDPAWAN